MANGNFGGGDGTRFDPYLVEDMEDLLAVNNDLDAHYAQTKTIDLSYIVDFIPIGELNGTYDGRKLAIKNYSSTRGGLFSSLTSGGVIQNIIIVDGDIAVTGASQISQNTGGIVNDNLGSVIGCNFSGTISLSSSSGLTSISGIAGSGTGYVHMCNFYGDIKILGTSASAQISGISHSPSIASSCTFTGSIYAPMTSSGTRVGGIVVNPNSVFDCHVRGDISAYSNNGGITSNMVGGSVKSCSFIGTIESGFMSGGIAGYLSNGSIEDCYVGTIDNPAYISSSGNNGAGGIVGEHRGGSIKRCHVSCMVEYTGTRPQGSYVGGVAARATGSIEDVFLLLVAISGGTTPASNIGDIYGANYGSTPPSIKNCVASSASYLSSSDFSPMAMNARVPMSFRGDD